ncbi:MAG: long-chain fatty acid--CoA ligase [Vicinamibacterales bacterium]
MVDDPAISTLADLPFHASGRYSKPVLVRRCAGDRFEEYSSREFFDHIRDLSLGLAGLGVQPGDRVALICESRPEWLMADLAILTQGAVTVPVYPTLPAAQVRHLLADAAASVAIAGDETQAAKVREAWPELGDLRTLIVVDASDGAGQSDRELTFADAQARGHRRLMVENGLAREFKETAAAIQPDQLATIIYTSGTTGDPKGVMLTHDAVVSNVLGVDTMVTPVEDDEALSFLPLSHALERTVMYLYLLKGVTITFAESTETIARDMQRVKPTVMTGVPRVYEKLHARVLETAAQASKVRQAIFAWALRVGRACSALEHAGGQPSSLMRVQRRVADRLVFSQIRERMGGRLRFVVSGGAALSTVVAEFLFAIGVPVFEGYGLTETAPVLTINPETAPRLGTVGKAIPRVELRIADDGEILARGPNVMFGYYGKPEATAEAIKGGWFCTGDIGRLDDDGYLMITDRKKELLVTAGGKNVAPQPIEQRLKQHPLVAEAMLVGDGRPFISVLILPDWAALAAAVPDSANADRAALVQRADVRARFDEVVSEVNADLPHFEQIRRFAALPTELSVEAGELTPTLKIKRRVVAEKWRATIDGLYER